MNIPRAESHEVLRKKKHTKFNLIYFFVRQSRQAEAVCRYREAKTRTHDGKRNKLKHKKACFFHCL